MVGGPDCASELSSQQIQTMDKLATLGNIHNPFKPKLQVGLTFLIGLSFAKTENPILQN